jgi:multidrug efflux pump subunit AcrA (membrane-fusion protein)
MITHERSVQTPPEAPPPPAPVPVEVLAPPPSLPEAVIPLPHAEQPQKPRESARARARLPRIAVVLAVLVVAAVAIRLLAMPSPSSAPPATAPEAVKLTARGAVQPIARARVGTLSGGVVVELRALPGDAVAEEQELARVRAANGAIEVVSAPFAGTATDVLVHVGDTVTPGTTLATVGDLSQLQVETTDVDEFLIGHVRRGQPVTLTVDALDDLPLRGRVRSVTLVPRTTTSGDEQYPVEIELQGSASQLRPGMSVRVDFSEQPG